MDAVLSQRAHLFPHLDRIAPLLPALRPHLAEIVATLAAVAPLMGFHKRTAFPRPST